MDLGQDPEELSSTSCGGENSSHQISYERSTGTIFSIILSIGILGKKCIFKEKKKTTLLPTPIHHFVVVYDFSLLSPDVCYRKELGEMPLQTWYNCLEAWDHDLSFSYGVYFFFLKVKQEKNKKKE